jgi:hypothetical protein
MMGNKRFLIANVEAVVFSLATFVILKQVPGHPSCSEMNLKLVLVVVVEATGMRYLEFDFAARTLGLVKDSHDFI